MPSEDGRELGKFDGSTDGESETIVDVGSLDGAELGFPLTDEEGDALGSCESPAVGFKDGVEEGPLLGDALSSKASVGLGTLEGCRDGESDSMLVVGSLDGAELGPPLREEEGDTLGTCDSRAVGFKEGVDDGSLLGVALLLPSEEGRELGMTDGSDDGVSDAILDVGSVDGKELGFPLTDEVGVALGTCDSPTVGFDEGAGDGSLLGAALLLPSEDGRELGEFLSLIHI